MGTSRLSGLKVNIPVSCSSDVARLEQEAKPRKTPTYKWSDFYLSFAIRSKRNTPDAMIGPFPYEPIMFPGETGEAPRVLGTLVSFPALAPMSRAGCGGSEAPQQLRTRQLAP